MLRRIARCSLIAVVVCAASLVAADPSPESADGLQSATHDYLQLVADEEWEQADALLESLAQDHPGAKAVGLMREHSQLRQSMWDQQLQVGSTGPDMLVLWQLASLAMRLPPAEEATYQTPAHPALQAKREQLGRLQAEIRELEQETGLYERVMVRCRFIEADRSIIPRLQLKQYDDHDVRASFPQSGVVSQAELDEAIESLRSKGDAKILASPSLIAENGRAGSNFSGGEFPILIPGDEGAHIEWREFGNRMEVTPTILGGGKLRLRARVERSDRDLTNAVTLAGTLIPGITTQRVQTQFELEFDQAGIVVLRPLTERLPAGESAEDAEAVGPDKIVLVVLTAEPIGSGE